jgi:hypothetical protein
MSINNIGSIEVRCPSEKPHGKFDKCGGLMGCIPSDMDTSAVFRCSCGSMWHVEYLCNNKTFTFKMVTNKVPMQRVWREVISD